MPRPDETSATEPNESRDRGLVTHAGAQRRWRASICAQPAQARRSALWRRLIYGERPEPIASHRGTVQAPGSTGICCSGGGIRSAAYNLGALQALQREGRLQKADYLAGVSGGSYIAAAFCMVGKTSKDRAADDSDPDLLEAAAAVRTGLAGGAVPAQPQLVHGARPGREGIPRTAPRSRDGLQPHLPRPADRGSGDSGRRLLLHATPRRPAQPSASRDDPRVADPDRRRGRRHPDQRLAHPAAMPHGRLPALL